MKFPTRKDALTFLVFFSLGMLCGICVLQLVSVEALKDYADALGVVVTAFATIAVALFTWRLWRSTEKLWAAGEDQLKHLKESSEQQLKAYIFFTRGGLKVVQVIPNSIHRNINVHVEFTNSGQTPGYYVTGYFGARIETYPWDGFPTKEEADVSPGHSFLGPGATHTAGGSLGSDVNELAEIRQFKKAVYAFGRYDYKDAFNKDRFVKFKYFCFGSNLETGAFAPCEDNNEQG